MCLVTLDAQTWNIELLPWPYTFLYVLTTLTHDHMSLGEEAYDPANLGSCMEVSEERVGDGELLYFRGCATGQACTVVLRGKS